MSRPRLSTDGDPVSRVESRASRDSIQIDSADAAAPSTPQGGNARAWKDVRSQLRKVVLR